MMSQKHQQLLSAIFYSDEFNQSLTDLSRRRFVTGLAAGSAMMGLGLGLNSQSALPDEKNIIKLWSQMIDRIKQE